MKAYFRPQGKDEKTCVSFLSQRTAVSTVNVQLFLTH